ncbi:cytochrome p450 [Coprinopsis cinerea AmutBmut pab1-1]|nr:cytochrome p450 [Coprinopsis cinerea AmutBmut pab1-1]
MASSFIPPGIAYLIKNLPALASPPALAYLLVRALEHGLDIDIPHWCLALGIALSFPAALTAKVQWRRFADERAAARLGAVMPTEVQFRLPAGFDFLLASIKDLYPGSIYVGNAPKYGWTHNIRILFGNRYVTSEPHLVKAYLATQFNEFEKGGETSRIFHPVLGTGVFAVDGEEWKFHRNMARPFFSKDRISHFDNFDRHAKAAITLMKARFAEGYAVDFQDLIARFTLDSATEFLFGNDVCSLAEGLPYPHFHHDSGNDAEKASLSESEPALGSSSEQTTTRFVQSFSKALEIVAFRTRFGDHWPLSEFWKDRSVEPMKVVQGYIDPIVKEAIRRKRESKGVEVDRDDETFLENLVNSTEDPAMLRDAIMNMLVAGRDTTACALTFIVYMLSEHPRALERLRDEILSKLGPDRRPTYEDLKDMKFLRAVINETLRLYPPVPINMRISKVPTLIEGKGPDSRPIYVPANTRQMYVILAMHRRKDLWGPDAEEFDPDRFLDDRVQKYLVPNPYIFLPFNAGPRICLGQQFAYNEVSFFLCRLLQNFSSISLCEKSQPPECRPPTHWSANNDGSRMAKEKVKPKSHLTLYVEGGLWVQMAE